MASNAPDDCGPDWAGTPDQWAAARAVLADLGLREADTRPPPRSEHNSSLLLPCEGAGGESYLLKFFIPPPEGHYYPAGVRLEDYARRESAFYRFLDSIDAGRRSLPAPRTVLIDSADPPRWILLERIASAVGPVQEVIGQEHVFDLLERLQGISSELLLGRRHFPLNRWDTISYLERVRLMYDPVLFVIGERRWTRCQEFFKEALRWTEARAPKLVHGDFTEQNVLVDPEGRPFLIDFERVGIGNEDHDLAWFWIHSKRSKDWKRALLERYLGERVGSDRIRSEWGIRASLVYLALRRLRFAILMHGDEAPTIPHNLALLDAALAGGEELFPTG